MSQCQAGSCPNDAVITVRLYETDDTTTIMDLCDSHTDDVAANYPDAIETVSRNG